MQAVVGSSSCCVVTTTAEWRQPASSSLLVASCHQTFSIADFGEPQVSRRRAGRRRLSPFHPSGGFGCSALQLLRRRIEQRRFLGCWRRSARNKLSSPVRRLVVDGKDLLLQAAQKDCGILESALCNSKPPWGPGLGAS